MLRYLVEFYQLLINVFDLNLFLDCIGQYVGYMDICGDGANAYDCGNFCDSGLSCITVDGTCKCDLN